jgi:CHASE3 domain sensor protein
MGAGPEPGGETMTRQPTTGETIGFAVVVLFCLTLAGMVGWSADKLADNLTARVATATHLRNF